MIKWSWKPHRFPLFLLLVLLVGGIWYAVDYALYANIGFSDAVTPYSRKKSSLWKSVQGLMTPVMRSTTLHTSLRFLRNWIPFAFTDVPDRLCTVSGDGAILWILP